jgi:hypothetical protein
MNSRQSCYWFCADRSAQSRDLVVALRSGNADGLRYCADVQDHGRQEGIILNGISDYEYDAVVVYNGPGAGEL